MVDALLQAGLRLQPLVQLVHPERVCQLVDHRGELVVALHRTLHRTPEGLDRVTPLCLFLLEDVEHASGVEIVEGGAVEVTLLDACSGDNAADVIEGVEVPLDEVGHGESERDGLPEGLQVLQVDHQHEHVDLVVVAGELVFQEGEAAQVAPSSVVEVVLGRVLLQVGQEAASLLRVDGFLVPIAEKFTFR